MANDNEPFAPRHRDGLSLSGEFRQINDTTLRLSYSVVSQREENAYLLTALFRVVDGQPKISTDLVYIYLHADRADFRKDIEELPPDVNVYMPESPYTRLLRAGATYREQVDVEIPLREHRAYLNAPSRPDISWTSTLTFGVGYILWTPGTTEKLMTVGDTEVVMWQPPAGGPWNPHGVLGFAQKLRVPARLPRNG